MGTRTAKKPFWHLLAVWAVAYAFLLQSVFASVAAVVSVDHLLAASDPAVICTGDHGLASDDTVPVGQHQHEQSCKLCICCPAVGLAAPDASRGLASDLSLVPVWWSLVRYSAPDKHRLDETRARGPPLLT